MELGIRILLSAAAVLAACGGIAAGVMKFVHWLDRQRQQDQELQKIRDEQCVICYALLACLDGLKQLGANGNVTKAHETLDKHINKLAHNEGGSR